ncbi:MAG TPA: M23 family metallopeptidase [Solirubrobacteraceae bacterium]|nr:M23 family metallopeptidase [Solirubrobacteraceae bacterium]
MRRFLVAALPGLATLALLGGVSPVRAASTPRPMVALLTVPKMVVAGRPPRVSLRIVEPGVASVDVQVSVAALSTHKTVVVANLGWVRTGRTLTVTWPRGATLTPGSYQVSVSAHDRRGETLRRGARTSGEASLTVAAPTPPTAELPAPVLPPTHAPEPAPEVDVPTVAQTVADGAVFPVTGPHNFGGPENAFGAPRTGYLHQGQDILTVEGTPVVVPLAGTILTTSYQEAGAGYYAVEETAIGFDFMFAHCQAGSLAVSTGQAVAARQALCKAGQTGDATAPHLDFEMWVGGWQAAGGRPINPLPYLEAWEA